MGLCRFPVRATAIVLGLLIVAVPGGCGPTATEVDLTAQYTPESLAQELAFRYRKLTPDAKKAQTRNRAKSKTTKSIAQLESSEKAQTKAKAAATEKKARTENLDDLLDEFETKLGLIKDVSQRDACRRVSEAISQDTSLTASEQKLLSEKIAEFGQTSS